MESAAGASSKRTPRSAPRRGKGLPRKAQDLSKEELLLTLQKKRECNARALKIVEGMLEPNVKEDWFLNVLQHLNQNHFQDIIEERSITRLCGYPLCPNELKNIPSQQFRISTKLNKVFDIKERKNFCSNQCFKASKFIKDQMHTSPLWLRDIEPAVKFILMPSSELSGGAGDEVDVQVQRVTKEEVKQLSGDDNLKCDPFSAKSLSDVINDLHIIASLRENTSSNITQPFNHTIIRKVETSEENFLKEATSSIIENIEKINVGTSCNGSDDSNLENLPEKIINAGEDAMGKPEFKVVEKASLSEITEEPEREVGGKPVSEDSKESAGEEEGKTHVSKITEQSEREAVENTAVKEDTQEPGREAVHLKPVLSGEGTTDITSSISPFLKNLPSIKDPSEGKSPNVEKGATQHVSVESGADEAQCKEANHSSEAGLKVSESVSSNETLSHVGPQKKNQLIKEPEKVLNSDEFVSTESKFSPVKFEMKENCNRKEHKRMNKKIPSKSATMKSVPTVTHVEKCTEEWFTMDTMCFLFGESALKDMLEQKGESIQAHYKALRTATWDQEKHERFLVICKRLRLLELEDNKFDSQVMKSDGEARLRPLPDYGALKREAETMELKVRAFYKGKMEQTDQKVSFSEDTKPTSAEDSDQGIEPQIPLVHLHSQRTLRKRIVLQGLNRVLPDFLRTFGMRPSELTASVRGLISTFALSATNITFKPHEWSLLGLIVIKLLSLREPELKQCLQREQSNTYLTLMLMSYKLEAGYLDSLLSWLTDVDKLLSRLPVPEDK